MERQTRITAFHQHFRWFQRIIAVQSVCSRWYVLCERFVVSLSPTHKHTHTQTRSSRANARRTLIGCYAQHVSHSSCVRVCTNALPYKMKQRNVEIGARPFSAFKPNKHFYKYEWQPLTLFIRSLALVSNRREEVEERIQQFFFVSVSPLRCCVLYSVCFRFGRSITLLCCAFCVFSSSSSFHTWK